MKPHFKLGSFFIATASFIGGVAAGFLLAPKEGKKNRKWVTSQAKNFNYWLANHRQTVADKSNEELNRLRNHIQQGVKHNIPDLYEATEAIPMNGDDATHG